MSQTPATGAIRNRDLLGIYCNDHLAASTGGVELVNRMLGRHSGTPYEEHLSRLLGGLREEQDALRGTMAALSLPVRQYKLLASWVGEKLSRGKLNGHLLSRSPSSLSFGSQDIDDGHLLNLLADWAPDPATRRAILVDNPATLYGFGK